jgi:hypothetical protein
VNIVIETFMIPTGSLGLMEVDQGRRSEAIRQLAETFDVNPVVAAIRFDELFPLVSAEQRTL